MSLKSDRKYAKSHEWVKPLEDGTALIGITDYAQTSLGDITYVQLPKAGSALQAGETFGVVESVKAASDLYAPASGEVLEANPSLENTPERINQSPYDEGWMLKIKLANPAELDGLWSADDYARETGI